MYTFADYERCYQDCKKSLELTKEILKHKRFSGIFPGPAIKELRESLINLFSRPELHEVCANCKGDCCVIRNFCLTPFELLCFAADNPDFKLPEPDWQFLEEELKRNKLFINNHCLFLSGHGCLLKEQRPIICLLFYDCILGFKLDSLSDRLKRILTQEERERIFFLLAENYSKARENFCYQVLGALGIPEDSSLAICLKGDLIHGYVGCAVCLETLEKLLDICKNKSP